MRAILTIPKSNCLRARNALFRRKFGFAAFKFALVLVVRRCKLSLTMRTSTSLLQARGHWSLRRWKRQKMTIPKSNCLRARNALFRRKLSFAALKFALVLVMRRRVYGGANFNVLAMLWVMLESWHRRRVRWRTWTSTIILNDTR